jgi:hypothetical protein
MEIYQSRHEDIVCKIVEIGRTGSFLLPKELAVAGSTVGLARKLGKPRNHFPCEWLSMSYRARRPLSNGIQPQNETKEDRNSNISIVSHDFCQSYQIFMSNSFPATKPIAWRLRFFTFYGDMSEHTSVLASILTSQPGRATLPWAQELGASITNSP